MPKYYVQDSHEAIITQEEFDLVQIELSERRSMVSSTYVSSVFSGRIFCGKCGALFGAKTWHSTDPYASTIFRCNRKYVSRKKLCDSPHISEKRLKEVLVEVINRFMDNKDSFIENAAFLEKTLFSTKDLEAQKAQLDIEVEAMKELYRKEISGKVICDSDKLNSIQDSYSRKLDEQKAVSAEITSRRRKALDLKRMAKELAAMPEILTEFSEEAFNGLVDRVTVLPEKVLKITFRNGEEIISEY